VRLLFAFGTTRILVQSQIHEGPYTRSYRGPCGKMKENKLSSSNLGKNRHHPHVSTPNGSRTRAACLEGKHDNRFTIGVTLSCGIIQKNTTVSRSARNTEIMSNI
jgi:hypothetical protein